jgi:hypothetical protein
VWIKDQKRGKAKMEVKQSGEPLVHEAAFWRGSQALRAPGCDMARGLERHLDFIGELN